MTEGEIVRPLAELPGVAVVTASEDSGAPQVAWGDSFFFYDPDDVPDDRRVPFATIVTKDYAGFDTDSDLDRAGVFRLNLAVGRERFNELFGFPPAEFAEHRSEFDYSVLDRVIPNPTYGRQGWISVLVPGGSDEQVRQLIAHAYERTRSRHRPSPRAADAVHQEPGGAAGSE